MVKQSEKSVYVILNYDNLSTFRVLSVFDDLQLAKTQLNIIVKNTNKKYKNRKLIGDLSFLFELDESADESKEILAFYSDFERISIVEYKLNDQDVKILPCI